MQLKVKVDSTVPKKQTLSENDSFLMLFDHPSTGCQFILHWSPFGDRRLTILHSVPFLDNSNS